MLFSWRSVTPHSALSGAQWPYLTTGTATGAGVLDLLRREIQRAGSTVCREKGLLNPKTDAPGGTLRKRMDVAPPDLRAEQGFMGPWGWGSGYSPWIGARSSQN